AVRLWRALDIQSPPPTRPTRSQARARRAHRPSDDRSPRRRRSNADGEYRLEATLADRDRPRPSGEGTGRIDEASAEHLSACDRLRIDPELLERLPRRLLFRGLLRAARPDADLLPVDRRRASEAPVVRRALDLDDRVADGAPPPRERLLELGLVVDVARRGIFDPARERVHDRGLDRLEAVLQEEGRERRLEERREHVPVAGQPLALFRRNARGLLAEPAAEVEFARDGSAARAGDDVRPDLREPALGEVREAVVELARNRQLEDAVAEELEPLVRRGAVRRPRGMGEDVLQALPRQRRDQPLELAVGPSLIAATGARR